MPHAARCMGTWGGSHLANETTDDLQWVQSSCKMHVSADETTGKGEMNGLTFCEEHGCAIAELAHFVLSFLCAASERNATTSNAAAAVVLFSAKYATSGRERGRLASGWLHIVCRAGVNLLSVHLINADKCRDLLMILATMCFRDVGGPPATPTHLDGVDEGSSACDVARSYHRYMRQVVWARMSALQASGSLPLFVMLSMAEEIIPYHIEWDAAAVSSGMEVLKLKVEQEQEHNPNPNPAHDAPCFVVRRLHLPPPMQAVSIVGSSDGRYIMCGDGTKMEREMTKQHPLLRMIIRDDHPLVEPHHPPVLAVPPTVVVSPSGQESLARTCSALHVCISDATTQSTPLVPPLVLPVDVRLCAVRCREQCWAEWTNLRIREDGACTTMAIFFLIRGAVLPIPITDYADHSSLLLPCVLAQPEHTHPGRVCLLVVPPNIPICWRTRHATATGGGGGGGREACVGVRARGPAGPLRQIYFTGPI